MQRHQQVSKQSQKFNEKFLGVSSSLLQAFLKCKVTMNKKQCVQRINKYSQFNGKRTQLFGRLLAKIMNKKQRMNKKYILGVLVQNQISDILFKREKLAKLRQQACNKSLLLISAIFTRNIQQKLRETFQLLRIRSLQRYQRMCYKMACLMSSVKRIQRRIVGDGVKRVKLESFRRLAGYKRCFVLESVYNRKRWQNIRDGFESIYGYCLSQKQSSKVSTQARQKQQSYSKEIKGLQLRQKNLQTELQQLRISKSLKPLETQIQKLQRELEGVRFEYELIVQDNSELRDNLEERQGMKDREFESRNRGSQLGQNIGGKLINEEALWKSVFDNLLSYLVEVSKKQHKQQVVKERFSVETLMQKLTEPLVSVGLYPKLEELVEQNDVLKELLATYRQASPEPELPQSNTLYHPPAELLAREKLYLIRSLECLSRWGTLSEQGLDEMRLVLQRFRRAAG